MTDATAFADVDIATGELQCAIRLQTLHRFGGRIHKKQRHDLDQAADADYQYYQRDQQAYVRFDFIVAGHRDYLATGAGNSADKETVSAWYGVGITKS